MYDNIYEHPKCPPESIIEDDDVLDGWMLKERKIREKEKEEELVDARFSNLKEADEVFLPARTKTDVEKINNLNDTRGKMVKQQRNSVIQSKGKAVDADFQDRQVALQAKSNEKFIEAVKGK